MDTNLPPALPPSHPSTRLSPQHLPLCILGHHPLILSQHYWCHWAPSMDPSRYLAASPAQSACLPDSVRPCIWQAPSLGVWGQGTCGLQRPTYTWRTRKPTEAGGPEAPGFVGLGPAACLPAHLDIDDRDGQLGLGEMAGHPVHCLGHVFQHQV